MVPKLSGGGPHLPPLSHGRARCAAACRIALTLTARRLALPRSLLDPLAQNAAPALGFANIRDACSTYPIDLFGSPPFAVPPPKAAAPAVCGSPSQYIFWDNVRATRPRPPPACGLASMPARAA